MTVNYGSGTPAEAAAWVSHAAGRVALWEVGNENYGCWEVNNWLAQSPENFQGYQPNNYSSPGNATSRLISDPSIPVWSTVAVSDRSHARSTRTRVSCTKTAGSPLVPELSQTR